MRCDFVGHPIAMAPQANKAEAAAFRARVAPDATPLVLVLPGSRRGEVSRLCPVFEETLKTFCAAHPSARVVVPAAGPVVDLVTELTANWPGNPVILDGNAGEDDKRAAFKVADVALAASGTVSLELAASSTPMVIAYDMNWLSRQIISQMLKVDTVTLVNLVSDTRVVPEFIGAKCQPALIAQGLADVLADPEQQTAAMALSMERLGAGGEDPGLRAARAVIDGVRDD